ESTALHILRILQEEAMKENSAAIYAQVPVDVATFLLNEKRAEIHTIESRFRVNVVLIPNIHLQTPNYNISRLRQDEATQIESAASYKMVEAPVAEAEAAVPEQETQPLRQKAAVQGITIGQPAPVMRPVKPTLITKILDWFKREEKEKEVEQPKARQPMRGRRRERFEQRAMQKGRAEGKPAPRGFRTERQRTHDRTENQPGQKPRQQRPEPKPESAAAKTERSDSPQEMGEHRGRRGKRGGRRDRGERKESHAMPVPQAPKPVISAPATPVVETAHSQISEASRQQLIEAKPASEASTGIEVHAESAPVHGVQDNVVVNEAATPAKILAELYQASESGDLVQIETSPEKTRLIAEELPASESPPKPQRIRPAQSSSEDEQLEQVETRK
ncbi:MAG: hypothetical protein ACREUJ_04175, partial [Burkholderiales bacterium]